MEKAQISIEFIMVVVILLIFLNVAIVPLANNSMSAVTDVKSAVQAMNAFNQLKEEINSMNYNSINSIKTIKLFIPKNSLIKCSPNQLRLSISLELPAKACNNSSSCTKNESITVNACPTQLIGDDAIHSIKLLKEETGVKVEWS